MRVVRSKLLGFCGGVSRAIKSANDALCQAESDRKLQGESETAALDGSPRSPQIFSLGPLIHNQIALDRLKERGLKILEENQIDLLGKDCVVIVRAHGVSPLVAERIKARGAKIVDATCPRVALSQKRAAEFAQKGMFVILAGDAGHAEVKAVEGSALCAAEAAGAAKTAYGQNCLQAQEAAADGCNADNGSKPKTAGNPFVLIQNAREAQALEVPPQMQGNAALLSQTTFSPKEFESIAKILSAKISGLQVFNTICPATGERQAALVELSKEVGALVVVGGKKSANSQRLFELAQSLCPASYFVESAADLPDDFGSASVVGLTAGASSPDFVIDDVEAKIKAM